MLYRAGVCCDSHAEALELRNALKTPEAFAKPGKQTGDTWSIKECADDCAVELATPEPPRKPWTLAEQDALRELQEARTLRAELWEGPAFEPAVPCRVCGAEHVLDHAHDALSPVLNALPEKHALIGPLEHADAAHSAWLCLRRWAHALAYYWGLDTRAFCDAVMKASK